MIQWLIMIVYWVLCYGMTIHVCLCACVILMFLQKANQTRFIVNLHMTQVIIDPQPNVCEASITTLPPTLPNINN